MAGTPRTARQDELVLDHLGLADAVARRFSARPDEREDLRQVARLGLVNAARRFDASLGNDFAVFAVPTISGEVKRHLRDCSAPMRAPRRLHERRGAVLAVRPALAQRLGRAPTADEVAVEIDCAPEEVREVEEFERIASPASLDAPVAAEEPLPLGALLGSDETGYLRIERLALLADAFRALTARQRAAIELSFFAERNQREIADALGVSQVHVSRLLAQALRRMRSALESEPQPAASSSSAASRTSRTPTPRSAGSGSAAKTSPLRSSARVSTR